MKRGMIGVRVFTTILLVVLFAQQTASACPSCYGASDAPMTQGMNMAILSLLGITGGVLVAFGSFFVYLRKRARGFMTTVHSSSH